MIRLISIQAASAALMLSVTNLCAQQGQRSTAPEDRILVQVWAETETVLSSPIVGQITQIPAQIGVRFEKDDVILRFECTENEARAKIAQSELISANEALEAKIRLKAMRAASEIEVTTAAAQVAKAQAQLTLSNYQVGQCNLIAPFTGHVVRIMGKPFQTTTVGQPLLELISAGAPRLRISANSKLFPKIKNGVQLKIMIDETGKSYDATVTAVNARIDPINQIFEVEARVKGDAPDLLPGMSGVAILSADPINVQSAGGQAP